jgi:hypothetical protein
MKYGMPTAKATITTPIRTPPHAQPIVASRNVGFRWETHFPAKDGINIPDREFSGSRTWRYERGLIRRPAIPPSTASDVPVTDDASGLAR